MPKYKYQVGVVCLTYNQVGYIGQCLDSLLIQKTNFSYKIIVHDDASTDGTTDVVREYATRYPNLIVPVLQVQNIYSRGISFTKFTDPLISDCKYTAFCEGDDWWLSEKKLQMQFEYMEAHPDCSLCVHNVIQYDDRTGRDVGIVPGCHESKNYLTDEIISKGGGFFGTNSIFYRVKDKQLPESFKGWGIGDYPTAIWLSSLGYAHCLPETMSAYRVNAKGSWTSSNAVSYSKVKFTNERIIHGLMQIDAYYQGKYADSVGKGIDLLKDGITWAKINCDFMHLDEECDPISSEEWRGFLSRQNTQGKLKAFVKRYAPWLGYIYSNVR